MELDAEHLGDQHRHRLAEHRRLGLDPPDPPAEHAEAVDHRRVRVGADERVRVGLAILVEHDPGEVLEVDLVDDARVRGDDGEVVERPLAPAQERVALAVAFELALGVDGEGLVGAERVDLDGVVDHELGRHERVDPGGVAAHRGDRVAHRGEVDDGGHAGEVLHQHARRRERDLAAGLGVRVPARERLHVRGPDGPVTLRAEEVLEQHLQRERQPRDVIALLQAVEAVDLEAAVAHRERVLRAKAVLRHLPSGRDRLCAGESWSLAESSSRAVPSLPARAPRGPARPA